MVSRPPGSGAVLLLLVVLAVPAAAGSAASPLPPSQETPGPPAVDNTVTRIELSPDGSARWTVTVRTRLPTAAAVEEFEAFQARFRENRSRFLDPFETRIGAVVANAAEATGREMTATEFAAETRVQEVPRRWGVVSYSFTWVGFAAVDGDALVVGDAFDGGFFLAENDTLAVVAPAGYAVTAAEPAPAQRGERSVTWIGREDFPDGRPMVRAAPSAADGEAAGAGSRPTPIDPALLGAGAVVLALLVGLATVAYRRRARHAPAGAAIPPSDEQRVLELLESRGGRVPQAAVVDAFGWSTSKTSRVLSRMAEDGSIEKLQLGRENLIRLPEDGSADE